jgi:hypothetical protein
LPKLRLSLDYLYIIGDGLLCCIYLWEAKGRCVGIDNETNRYVCDMNSEVSERYSVRSNLLFKHLGRESAEFLYDALFFSLRSQFLTRAG